MGGHVEIMVERKGGYRNFGWETKSKRDHLKYPSTAGDVIKVDHREDQYRDKRRTAVGTALNIQFSQKAGNFFAICSAVSY